MFVSFYYIKKTMVNIRLLYVLYSITTVIVTNYTPFSHASHYRRIEKATTTQPASMTAILQNTSTLNSNIN